MELKTARDFYNFFSGIPKNRWTTGRFKRAPTLFESNWTYCALGHLRMHLVGSVDISKKPSLEVRLDNLMLEHFAVGTPGINDGVFSAAAGIMVALPEISQHRHPKHRILKALSIIIDKEEEAAYRKTAMVPWVPVASRVAKWSAVPVTTLGMPELPKPKPTEIPDEEELPTAAKILEAA